jgi:hypothetical protein
MTLKKLERKTKRSGKFGETTGSENSFDFVVYHPWFFFNNRKRCVMYGGMEKEVGRGKDEKGRGVGVSNRNHNMVDSQILTISS